MQVTFDSVRDPRPLSKVGLVPLLTPYFRFLLNEDG